MQVITQVMGTVLVVEDRLPHRKLIEELSAARGLPVITAPDGATALNQLLRVRSDPATLDIIVPRFRGFQVRESVEGDPGTSQLPVIQVTALPCRQVSRNDSSTGGRCS